ncbi:MAG TPA: hydrogenase, partial [Planctomycetes bacterium]|nr:hydrogenase [Planctomycetota bacterium]
MDLLTLQRLALEVAELRSPDEVLRNLVARLAGEPHVALARIWLIEPGDLCASCHFASECSERERCLHLVASAGHSLSGERYTGLGGRFQRFPLGVRKVGRIGATGKAERLCLRESGTGWIADLPWSEREQIQTFAGQPLVFRGEILGVLGLFSREVIEPEQHAWLRIFADQAAVSLANARAFAEVERLRAQLELERDYLRDEVSEGRSL